MRPEFKIINVKNTVLLVLGMYFVYLITSMIRFHIIIKFNIILIIYDILQKEFFTFNSHL